MFKLIGTFLLLRLTTALKKQCDDNCTENFFPVNVNTYKLPVTNCFDYNYYKEYQHLIAVLFNKKDF